METGFNSEVNETLQQSEPDLLMELDLLIDELILELQK